MTDITVGRRERKKARTRQAIADAARALFLERGFDAVTVKEVAEAADVSMSGLFKHFPTKESLVFDEDDDIRHGLVRAVRDRPDAVAALRALRQWLLDRARDLAGDPDTAAFFELIAATPALSDYGRRMWQRHEQELAEAIRQAGPDAPGAGIAARAVARFALDRSQPCPHIDPQVELDAAFALLSHGWPAPELRRPRHHTPSAAPPAPARPPGLRERKKAQTRQAITRAALELFTERGYDHVGVREIAEAAEVSPGTLFAHFPDGKASLLFPGDQRDTAAALVDAVRHRPPGQTIPRALHGHIARRGPFKPDPTPEEQRVLALIRATPELTDHALRAWTAAEPALTSAIAEEAGLPADDPTARLLAHYFLQIPDLAVAEPHAGHALDVITGVLEHGWPQGLATGTPPLA
ncbi:TetR family transcriptional regulator [Dactylosporangium aurantiacum]|uniref:TetR family transcriptional regulator n=1 Tax=Dactylosporangium aurantiacum TaxID=35754 RepID=A0A9Q9IM56_9ACTN|nr:TetR/AcrR family transcriptional regulator [Dactylosporangium aurantiacum]MDG6109905.1 TetR/AcrR family transcriptional regulator [Dactylosporangium aurantiacum]UWZ58096.1 TetR family transcriptional regulator [Dactylosporangium aurantiacum]